MEYIYTFDINLQHELKFLLVLNSVGFNDTDFKKKITSFYMPRKRVVIEAFPKRVGVLISYEKPE